MSREATRTRPPAAKDGSKNSETKIRAAHKRLAEAVTTIVSGEDWQRMLELSSRFHHYSPRNQLMIWSQNPHATFVAGYRAWEKVGRQVRRGEGGIQILAPAGCRCRSCKDKEPDESGSLVCELCGGTARLTRFRIAYVFDVSQTDGEGEFDVGTLAPRALEGDAPEDLWDRLVRRANDIGFKVVREGMPVGNGYCDFATRTLAVKADVSEMQAMKTLVHELAHGLCHAGMAKADSCRQEVEAESTAYVVLKSLGLTTDDYSFPYVASWSGGSVDLVEATAEKVIMGARNILNDLDSAPPRGG